MAVPAGTASHIGCRGLPLTEGGGALAILIELGGALALIAGLGTRLAAFTRAATLVFQNHWGVPADPVMLQQPLFYKNSAVVGAC